MIKHVSTIMTSQFQGRDIICWSENVIEILSTNQLFLADHGSKPFQQFYFKHDLKDLYRCVEFILKSARARECQEMAALEC